MNEPVSPRSPAGMPAFTPGIGLREVLEAAPDLIFCCDAAGRFAWASSTFEIFAGWRATDLVGRHFTELLPEVERPRVVRFFTRQLRRARRQSVGDFTLLCRDGSHADVTARVRLYERPDGESYFVGVARERLPLAAAPGGEPGAMAGEVAMLEARLRELQSQLDDAREGERLKTDVLATLSHEIRPPMDAVIGAAATLLETSLSADQRRLVEAVRDASQSLLALVAGAYDHAQIEAGRMAIASIGFDLRVTIDQVAAALAPLAEARGAAFRCQLDPLLPSRLTGDPGRLRQVLLSLSTCALRTAGHAGITLRIERESEDDGHVTVLFKVTDPGVGAVAERRARVFRDASHLPGAAERQWGSAELALSIARRLVCLMGGLVGVDSVADGGNAYWFRLTFAKQANALAAPAVADVRLRGVRLLVADQFAAERHGHAATLAAWGCEVAEAENGIEALECIRTAAAGGRPIAVALVDMSLEGLDGESLAAAVRADAGLAATALVLTTRVGRPGDALHARELGCAAYLVKPLDASQLFDALVELLAADTAAGAARRPLVTRHSLAEARRARIRVLLVEDDAVNQLVTKSALNRVGFHVEVAASGRAAIAATESVRWDLILMDLQMPDLDGLQATAAIRARERGAWRTPILGMSAAGDIEAERLRCAAAGMDDVISKPIDLPALTATAERWTRAGDVRAAEEDAAARRERPEGVAVVAGRFEPAAEELELPALADGPALDLEQLDVASMGLPALRESMLNTFLGDVFQRLQRLEGALEAGELAAVQAEAHGLRGMCVTVGASNCTLLFGEFERWAAEGRTAALRRLLPVAVAEVRRCEEFIARLERVITPEAA